MAEKERSIEVRRREGVEKAWARERDLVAQGRGTREWTLKEQKQMLKKGSVDGYEGHHMKSVKKHPEYADDPKNIQFLSRKEHQKAHKGNFRNESNGRYSERTQKIREMKDGKPRAMNSYELKEKAIEKRGYRKYAREDPKAKNNTRKNTNERVAVKKRARKSEKAAKPKSERSAKASARYGRKAASSRPGVKQSGVKSSYGSKAAGVKASGPRTGGYGKGGQTGGKAPSAGGKGAAPGGHGGHGGHGGSSGGGHGGHGGHGGR